jgi:hypothetical protein
MLNAIAQSLNLHMSKNLQPITVEDALGAQRKINEIIRPYPIHAKSNRIQNFKPIKSQSISMSTNQQAPYYVKPFSFHFFGLKNEPSATLYNSVTRVNQQHPPVQMKDGW